MLCNKRLKGKPAHRPLALATLTTLLLCSLLVTGKADALYILTGADDSAIVLDDSAVRTESMDFSSRLVLVGTNNSGQPELTLGAGQTVTISYEGAELTVTSRHETMSALLNRVHIVPGPLEMVGVDVSGPNIEVTVSSDLTFYDKVVEADAYEEVRRANPNMAKGTEQVTQAGRNGTKTSTYEVIYANGELVSRQLVEESEGTAVDQITEYGTKVSSVSASDRISQVSASGDGGGYLTFASGDTMRYQKVLSMTGTAYTQGYGGVGTRTATGTTVRKGTVAVDPKVIPLGSRLYVVTANGSVVYGMAVAEDTGVRGNHIDLYHDTYNQCINFGRRACTVYVLD